MPPPGAGRQRSANRQKQTLDPPGNSGPAGLHSRAGEEASWLEGPVARTRPQEGRGPRTVPRRAGKHELFPPTKHCDFSLQRVTWDRAVQGPWASLVPGTHRNPESCQGQDLWETESLKILARERGPSSSPEPSKAWRGTRAGGELPGPCTCAVQQKWYCRAREIVSLG